MAWQAAAINALGAIGSSPDAGAGPDGPVSSLGGHSGPVSFGSYSGNLTSAGSRGIGAAGGAGGYLMPLAVVVAAVIVVRAIK